MSCNEYETHGYVILRQLLTSTEASDYYQYTLRNMDKGNMKDDQVPGSPSFYQDERMAALHKRCSRDIAKAIGKETLMPTFCYYRTYRAGAILRAHKDRAACEIGVSINLGQQGGLWSFWLMDFDENAREIILAPGDAIIYQGPKLLHWRGKLTDADLVSQVFFFYVNPGGWNRLYYFSEYYKKMLKRVRNWLGVRSY